jgi:uncharacterized protein
MAEPIAPIPLGKVAAGLALQATLFTAAGAALWHGSGHEFERFVDWTWRAALGGILFGAALIASAASVFRLFPGVLEKTTHLQSKMAALFTPDTNWGSFVFIALCAGIGEEAFFRGGLQTILTGHVGAAWAIALSSLAFALFHMAKPLIFAVLLLIGVLFGVVYWWTESLLTVMIAHTLYDIWALAVLRRELVRLGYLSEKPELSTN